MISRRRCIAGLGLLATLVARPASAQGLGLTGQYQVDGRNPDGSRYYGVARMVQVGRRVSMTWQIEGGQTYEGVGTLDGSILTIDWGADLPVIYDVSDPYRLVGTWAGGRASEILTAIP